MTSIEYGICYILYLRKLPFPSVQISRFPSSNSFLAYHHFTGYRTTTNVQSRAAEISNELRKLVLKQLRKETARTMLATADSREVANTQNDRVDCSAYL